MELVGRGTFGKVYKYLDKNTGIYYATKQHECYDEVRGLYESSSLKEIDIMRKFDSPFILKLLRFDVNNKCSINIVMPLMDGSLHDYLYGLLSKGTWINPIMVRDVFSQLAHGLSYLHSNGIWHNDIKFANCLYKNNGNGISVMWSDFGSTLYNAWKNPHRTNQLICSEDFRPPEVREGDFLIYPTSDIWNFGMMLFYMISEQWRMNIYPKSNYKNIFTLNSTMYVDNAYKGLLLNEYRSKGGNDIILGMLNPNPIARSNIKQVVNNPYVIPTGLSQTLKPIPPIKYSLNAGQFLMMKRYLDVAAKNMTDFQYYLFADICHRCPLSFNDENFTTLSANISKFIDNNRLYGAIENVTRYQPILNELDGYIYRPYIYDMINCSSEKIKKYKNAIYNPNYLNFDVMRL